MVKFKGHKTYHSNKGNVSASLWLQNVIVSKNRQKNHFVDQAGLDFREP